MNTWSIQFKIKLVVKKYIKYFSSEIVFLSKLFIVQRRSWIYNMYRVYRTCKMLYKLGLWKSVASQKSSKKPCCNFPMGAHFPAPCITYCARSQYLGPLWFILIFTRISTKYITYKQCYLVLTLVVQNQESYDMIVFVVKRRAFFWFQKVASSCKNKYTNANKLEAESPHITRGTNG